MGDKTQFYGAGNSENSGVKAVRAPVRRPMPIAKMPTCRSERFWEPRTRNELVQAGYTVVFNNLFYTYREAEEMRKAVV